MRKTSQELTSELTKLRSQLEDYRKRALELEKDGKSIDSAGKPVTVEARTVLLNFYSTKESIKLKEQMLAATTKLEALQSGDKLQVAANKAKITETAQKAADKKAALESLGKAGTEEWNKANAIMDSSAKKLEELSDPKQVVEQLKSMSPLKDLPIQLDPELLKQQAIAEAQKYKSQAEELLQQKKEEEINKLKEKVEAAAGPFAPALGLFSKPELADPKFLAQIAYEKGKQKIRELKQNASKENLKKSTEAFTFPMKPPMRLELGELPQIPEIPKIPELPKINLPNLPDIP
jgi:hypothetical protein